MLERQLVASQSLSEQLVEAATDVSAAVVHAPAIRRRRDPRWRNASDRLGEHGHRGARGRERRGRPRPHRRRRLRRRQATLPNAVVVGAADVAESVVRAQGTVTASALNAAFTVASTASRGGDVREAFGRERVEVGAAVDAARQRVEESWAGPARSSRRPPDTTGTVSEPSDVSDYARPCAALHRFPPQLSRTDRRGSPWSRRAVAPQKPGAVASDGSVTVKHAFGETKIPGPPKRVVSAGFTEQDDLLALGVVPIAVTDWFGSEPFGVWPWAQAKLGGAQPAVLNLYDGIQVDQIAALKPDLIVATNAGLDADTYTKLSAIAPTIAQSGQDAFFEPWKDQANAIGQAVFKVDDMDKLVAAVDDKFADAGKNNAVVQRQEDRRRERDVLPTTRPT